ncbi:MAG: hypothetical protein HGJ94_06425 [Desulfosarcina sp.]|nr:hypothetical protein [Desulfosarcina sp.]
MENLFKTIKQKVPLLQYIIRNEGYKITRVGTNTHRVNPCFLCNHNECLTVYNNETFYCFSCQVSGDVISYEKLIGNYNNNLEAARSVAENMNIPT